MLKANGGKVIYGPEDVFDSGRMMVIQDPTSAALNLWQPYTNIGAKHRQHRRRDVLERALATDDTAGAKRFYYRRFAWEFHFDGIYSVNISNRGHAPTAA